MVLMLLVAERVAMGGCCLSPTGLLLVDLKDLGVRRPAGGPGELQRLPAALRITGLVREKCKGCRQTSAERRAAAAEAETKDSNSS